MGSRLCRDNMLLGKGRVDTVDEGGMREGQGGTPKRDKGGTTKEK